MVNKLYWPHVGGVEEAVRNLAIGLRELNQKDLSVRVLAANTSLKTVRQEIDGIPVTKVASLGRLRSAPLALTLPFWLGALKSDIYHFHFPSPPFEVMYLGSSVQGKLVVSYHTDIVRQQILLKFYSPLIRRFLAKAEVIITSSPNMVKYSPFLSQFNQKCVVIPYGIDIKRFELTPKASSKLKEIQQKYGSPLLLFVGRLIYYKGLEYLIEAMKDINASLIIVGKGPLQKKLAAQAQKLGVADRIQFLGEVADEELPLYFHACDIFVLPSVERSEAFGLVQLEAHACSKPVVSTNLTTSVPFANLDGKTGLVVPPRSSEALAQATNKLLADSNLRKQLGEAGKQRVEKEFTREVMAKKVMEVYKGLLDDGSRASDEKR